MLAMVPEIRRAKASGNIERESTARACCQWLKRFGKMRQRKEISGALVLATVHEIWPSEGNKENIADPQSRLVDGVGETSFEDESTPGEIMAITLDPPSDLVFES